MTKGITSSKLQLIRLACTLFLTLASLTMFASAAWSRESVIALGKVYWNGGLGSAASPIGADIACSQTATGGYFITVTSPGAFAGATEDDFLVETTMEDLYANDHNSGAAIQSITNDVLTVRVRTFDLENTTFVDLAVAANAEFFFVIRRVDQLVSGQPFESRHLVALGTMRSSGLLDHGFGVGGISILTGRGATGEYFIQLAKPGGFTSDSGGQYVLLLSPRGVSVPDVSVRGSAYNATPDDNVTFYIRSEDVQQAPTSDDPVAADTSLAFAIFNPATQDAGDEIATTLLKAVVSVDGSTGNLVAGRTSYPGATISSLQTSTGRYDVLIESPGAFAGVEDAGLAAFVTLNSANNIDELAKTRVAVVDANRIRIDVSVDDVQQNNDPDGIPSDGSFVISLYDAAPVLRHDLRISSKASGAGARGTGFFNGTGSGQSQTLRLSEKRPRSAYFRSSNSGDSLDALHLKSGKISSSLKVNFFLTSGVRRNITAFVRSGAMLENDLYPNESVAIQGTFRYRSLTKRPKSKIFLRSLSGYQPANQDTNQVSLKAD